MRRLSLIFLASLALCVSAQAETTEQTASSPQQAQRAPVIRLVQFDDPILPITALRITKAIEEAEEAGDAFVLIELDTPGGMVDSMEKIVKRMLAAEIPIVVWVGPAGAHAASAGFFLLIAADVAAMAPGTRAGASRAIVPGGENREDDVALMKANEDLAALIRSIADRRGRDVEACEKAVFEAKAYEETVALEKGLIDLIAANREELLAELHQREVQRFDGTTTVLQTADARFVETEFSLKHEFMEILAIPFVAAFLFFAGLLGIYVEFTNPGVVFPGVAGALCLLLFALSAQMLPVSVIGVLLIVLALVMFILEIKVTSFGMLTLGGAVALVIGGWMLIDGPIPELRVPLEFVLPLAITITAVCAVALRFAIRAHQAKVGTGREGLAGEIGTVSHDLAPEGKVFVHGEIWNAVAVAGPIPRGTRVRVVGVNEMTLTVEPAGPGIAPSGGVSHS